MGITYDLKEAVGGGGADRDTRGRVCSPSHKKRRLGRGFGEERLFRLGELHMV
jgi:hypothetical protein